MAPLQDFRARKVVLLYLIPLLFLCSSFSAYTAQSDLLSGSPSSSRRLLGLQTEEEGDLPIKKKPTSTLSPKNQTKLLKPSSVSPKNQTKLIKTIDNSSAKNKTKLIKPTLGSPKNQTKLIKSIDNSLTKNKTKLIKPTINSTSPTIKPQLKKLNSTSKPSNSAKPTSTLPKKSSDLTNPTTPKNKTTKPIITTEPKSKIPDNKKPKTQKPKQPSWIDEDDQEDLVSEFRDLPSRFQETLLPDLERISLTSKVYLNKANKEITNGFKPLVGKKYAPAIASIVSCAFILIPLILVSLIFNRIKAYFSLQKLLIFIQIYLSIYFTILCLSALVTGLEPLRFFYATSQSTYICIQVLQTLGYVLYLLLLLMYLVLVFSTETGLASKLLGLGQTFVGFAVGLHYYVTVFHRAVLHQPPKSSWKVHAIYATCFFLICLLDRAERRKKAYLEEGGAEGKKS